MSAIHLVGTIGNSMVAMPADAVEAVVRIDHVVPVPGAPPTIMGLAAIRSRILTLIDSAVVVGESGGAAAYMAIVSIDGHGYGLTLDAVDDVVELVAIQPVPTTPADGWAALSPRICDHQGRVLLVIEPKALIAAATITGAQAA